MTTWLLKRKYSERYVLQTNAEKICSKQKVLYGFPKFFNFDLQTDEVT